MAEESVSAFDPETYKFTRFDFNTGLTHDNALSAGRLSQLAYRSKKDIEEQLPRRYRLNSFTETRDGYGTVFYTAVNTKQKTNQDLIVAFRGTDSLYDGWKDIQFLPTKGYTEGAEVSNGFLEAYEEVRSEVHEVVGKHLAENPDAKILLTGHSLGGALALLCVSDLIAHNPTLKSRIELGQDLNMRLSTYGAPTVGNKPFAKEVACALTGETDIQFRCLDGFIAYTNEMSRDFVGHVDVGHEVSLDSPSRIRKLLGIKDNWLPRWLKKLFNVAPPPISELLNNHRMVNYLNILADMKRDNTPFMVSPDPYAKAGKKNTPHKPQNPLAMLGGTQENHNDTEGSHESNNNPKIEERRHRLPNIIRKNTDIPDSPQTPNHHSGTSNQRKAKLGSTK